MSHIRDPPWTVDGSSPDSRYRVCTNIPREIVRPGLFRRRTQMTVPAAFLSFTHQEFFLPDIRLLKNGKKGPGSQFPVAWDRNEPPFLLIPEVDVADAFFHGTEAEQDKRPDYIM